MSANEETYNPDFEEALKNVYSFCALNWESHIPAQETIGMEASMARVKVELDMWPYLHGEPQSQDDAYVAYNGQWYRRLNKGEFVREGDMYTEDDGSWVPATGVGSRAPDPSFTSHRVYHRAAPMRAVGAVLPSVGDGDDVGPLRTYVGAAKDPDSDEEVFEMALAPDGTMMVKHSKTGKFFNLGWHDLLHLAELAGISK